VPHWFFADWAAGFQSGEPVREKEGNSAFQDLMYILTLESAAEMEQAFGIPSMADHYMRIASVIRGTIRAKYWDAARGLFADTYDHRSFSQHVNSLAILAGIVTGEEAAEVMARTLNDPSLIQATIYFRYYVHQALKTAGMGDRLLDNLQIWRDQMALGLTTWAEMPEPTRSDCHAWGASPNIEFFRILLGIDSNAPGSPD
jgi:alpha-L-rhamnosidase